MVHIEILLISYNLILNQSIKTLMYMIYGCFQSIIKRQDNKFLITLERQFVDVKTVLRKCCYTDYKCMKFNLIIIFYLLII